MSASSPLEGIGHRIKDALKPDESELTRWRRIFDSHAVAREDRPEDK